MAWAIAAAVTAGVIAPNATVATAVCAGIASFFIVLAARTSTLQNPALTAPVTATIVEYGARERLRCGRHGLAFERANRKQQRPC